MQDQLAADDQVVAFVSLGDDSTDEDMFQVLKDEHFSIKVGVEHSAATYHLHKQDDVKDFLLSCIKEFRGL